LLNVELAVADSPGLSEPDASPERAFTPLSTGESGDIDTAADGAHGAPRGGE
jgi:hypothetical protein